MPKKSARSSSRLKGKIVAFNISPKGHVEGVLLTTPSGTCQINFPKHERERDAFARSFAVGQRVELNAELEADDGDHPVYRLRPDEETAEVAGTIVRLNHALHGEVNGCHLDDGTFVHLKPEGAAKHKLKIGERIRASGMKRLGPSAVVLEAKTVKRTAR